LSRDEGSIAFHDVPVFSGTTIQGRTVSFTLASPSSVGIIVQRIVGRTRAFGRAAPKLRFVGRVPFGHFTKRRRHRVLWNLEVNGHRLAPGRYLVTPRSVTKAGAVRDLGTSKVVRVR
jgi:hypothetical protein